MSTGAGTGESAPPTAEAKPPGQQPAKSGAKDITLPPGTRLGGFELGKVIGRGGMATVYRGMQLSLKRAVAVKVLAARFSRNRIFVQRFDIEAGALANLNHPNIVNIIDKGVQDDHYYFVMELVDGITLDQLLHSTELTERHYMHIIREIEKALSYVHSKGIIHRDIKPSNVLVNRGGVVKVSDFGIAHITDPALAGERMGKQKTVGTANYMAPEQAANPEQVDERADIYSLAVTFYKMFTKQLPMGDLKAPSFLNPKIPRTIDAIIQKGMSQDPADRFATVQQFCEALVDTFQPVSKPGGVDAASQMTGPLIFNPDLVSGTGQGATSAGGGDADSSASSLFNPFIFPAADSGMGTPSVLPTAQELRDRQRAAAEAAAEEERKRRRTMFIWLGALAGVSLAVGLVAVVVWLFRSGYF